MPSRLAHDEPSPATSSAVAARQRRRSSPAPWSARAKLSNARWPRSQPPPSATVSRRVTETSVRRVPPRQSAPATASTIARSPLTTARSSEPPGQGHAHSSIWPLSAVSAAAASPIRNSAFGRPPLCLAGSRGVRSAARGPTAAPARGAPRPVCTGGRCGSRSRSVLAYATGSLGRWRANSSK